MKTRIYAAPAVKGLSVKHDHSSLNPSYSPSKEVLLAQFSLYVHKGGLKPDSFHFHFISRVK